MISKRDLYLKHALQYAHAVNALYDDKIERSEHKKWQKTTNQEAKKCYDIFDDLRKSNKIYELEDLMFHEDPHVRCLSASCCLHSDSQTAEKVLEELIESYNGEIGMSALTSLKVWRGVPWTEDRYK